MPGLAELSLAALAAAVIISCFLPINVGLLSIALAYLLAKPATVNAGFPVSLFLTLLGAMFLFSLAAVNGTLEQVARRSVVLARGNRGLIALVFFVLAIALSAAGPGGIAASALLSPIAMTVAGEVGISAFLMALLVANGANAGTFSPLAPTGIIARDLMARIGLSGMEWPNFWNTLAAQSFVALAGFLIFGGVRLFRESAAGQVETQELPAFTRRQVLTLVIIGGMIAAVGIARLDIGVCAFVAAGVVTLGRLSDEEAALKRLPWGVILMVSGVSMLVGVLEKSGGMAALTSSIRSVSNPGHLPGIMALVTGVISVYSSSSGVVLPAFLPMIPGLGGNSLMIAYAVNVGAHLVDVSPLSTIGALCIASAPAHEDRAVLFRKLLIWGWSMALVGAIVCQLFFGYR